ncbi:probable pectinesterase/pectinesterase inhibitor 58 [Musa acuminata AAA Group]|uniref:probable pectinesterase/pectinesterase inhibitor 58 n=1 Tax=Musa acuminata AAA Group TaxID=214697 RepID=UPI0031DC0D70
MSSLRGSSPMSGRRREEKRQTQTKRLMMAGATTSVMLILEVVGVAAVQCKSNQSAESSLSGSGSASTAQFRTTSAIQAICTQTNYKSTCESTLKKYVNESSAPKDLVRAAVLAVVDGVGEAFNISDSIQSDDLKEKGADRGLQGNSPICTLPHKVHELKNWLGGTMADQQTCIDGFPEGELKSKMQAAMDSAMDITSNALAISGKISSFLNLIQATGFSRRLLEAEPAEPGRYVDSNPSWVSHGDRKLLQTPATLQFTPNVTVAKDGSGNFTALSEAVVQVLRKFDESPSCTSTAIVTFTATAPSAAPSTSSSASPPLSSGFLTVRRPQAHHGTVVFAQSRVRVEESTGFISQNCSFVAVPALTDATPKVRCILGRPWNAFSTTIIMESNISGFIDPEGYIPMNGDIDLNTSSYFEFNNKGLDADTSKGVKWPGVKTISWEQAKAYTVEEFFHGREWIPS